jgi:tellurite resistance protein TerC
MLALDLGFFRREARAVGLKEAAVWSAIWIALALVFAVGIGNFWHLWHPEERGSEKAIEFITGYLVEKGLSVDNLFVFLVIFRYFAVPAQLQHRVLSWGILGALLMRALLVVTGAALLARFHWMSYVFGGFVLFTAYKMLGSVEEQIDPGRNPLLRMARRLLPVAAEYDSPRFWVRREGRWLITPLPLVLLVVETTDVVFALDSIPAVFGITKDTFIVYTSNIFAILGLRALYFLLANVLGRFRYLHVGLAAVLAFVGIKMLVEEPLEPYFQSIGLTGHRLILLSLGVTVTILGLAVLLSVLAGPKKSTPPQRSDLAVEVPPDEPR